MLSSHTFILTLNLDPPELRAFKLSLTGDAATFDQDAFVATLSEQLGVRPEQIVILDVNPGSVVVDFAVRIFFL